jgi:hypothetical protein
MSYKSAGLSGITSAGWNPPAYNPASITAISQENPSSSGAYNIIATPASQPLGIQNHPKEIAHNVSAATARRR